jgi:hypothetical protein
MSIVDASQSIFSAFNNLHKNEDEQRRVLLVFRDSAYAQDICYLFSVLTE